jgi:hypothetical protein
VVEEGRNNPPPRIEQHTEETKRKIGAANSKHQQGEKNSQYGTCWIFSNIEKAAKKIIKSDLNYHLQQGWQIGRKLKFD